jgi:hypothetical protein
MRLSTRLRALVTGFTVAGSLLAAGSAAASTVRHAPNHKINHSTSSNWSGYAVSGHGPYTRVSANWTQPAVNCSVTPSAYSSFWIGLDGDTTNTVEQTGSEGDCSGGQPVYYAWYEMYPKFPVNFPDAVSPGDNFSSSVVATGGGNFTLSLSDTTKGWTHTVTQKLKSAKLGSAEAIAEAPSGSGGVLPLADFGNMGFSAVTVNGSVLNSSTAGLDPITMASGSTVKASISSLSRSGSFTDTWQHA